MNRHDRRAAAAEHPFGWTPWEVAKAIPPTDEQIESMIATLAPKGYTREEVDRQFKLAMDDRIMLNNVYQVAIRRFAVEPSTFTVIDTRGKNSFVPSVTHLSIKRRDRQRVGTCRFVHFQRIKDDLVGPEFEAVELYPARSRLTDLANQYHLWVLPESVMRFPFGFVAKPDGSAS